MSEPQKANLIQSMALGGTSAVFAVNFTHRKFYFFVSGIFDTVYYIILYAFYLF